MTINDITFLTQQAIWVTLKIAGPVLFISLVVGLIVSIIQTTTSIQEQTLTFVPKILAIMTTIFLLISLMAQELITFTKMLFAKIPMMWK